MRKYNVTTMYCMGNEIILDVEDRPDLSKSFDFTQEDARMQVLQYLAKNDLRITRASAATFPWAAMYRCG